MNDDLRDKIHRKSRVIVADVAATVIITGANPRPDVLAEAIYLLADELRFVAADLLEAS